MFDFEKNIHQYRLSQSLEKSSLDQHVVHFNHENQFLPWEILEIYSNWQKKNLVVAGKRTGH